MNAPATAAPLVKVRQLEKTYRRGSERIAVLQGVDLDIAQGEFLALMGPSGSGKTTLLNLLGGLDQPDGRQRSRWAASGSINSRRAPCHAGAPAHVGFVFQLYNLLPVLTARAQRGAAAAAHAPVRRRAPQARAAIALSRRRSGRSRQALSAAALGRPGAARGHRAGDRHRPDAAALRRADRRSRSEVRRRDPRRCWAPSTATTARRS